MVVLALQAHQVQLGPLAPADRQVQVAPLALLVPVVQQDPGEQVRLAQVDPLDRLVLEEQDQRDLLVLAVPLA